MSNEGTGRIVRKVVITYTTAEDPEREQTLTLEHGGTGEQIDGIVWSDELMRKLAYLEGDSCREPKKERGAGKWNVNSPHQTSISEVSSTEQDSGVRTDCVWVHDIDCTWWAYCPK